MLEQLGITVPRVLFDGGGLDHKPSQIAGGARILATPRISGTRHIGCIPSQKKRFARRLSPRGGKNQGSCTIRITSQPMSTPEEPDGNDDRGRDRPTGVARLMLPSAW